MLNQSINLPSLTVLMHLLPHPIFQALPHLLSIPALYTKYIPPHLHLLFPHPPTRVRSLARPTPQIGLSALCHCALARVGYGAKTYRCQTGPHHRLRYIPDHRRWNTRWHCHHQARSEGIQLVRSKPPQPPAVHCIYVTVVVVGVNRLTFLLKCN